MRRLSLFLRVAGVVVGLLAAGCSHGSGSSGKLAVPKRQCPSDIPFVVTYLPAGFQPQRVAGPAPGRPAAPNAAIYHYNGPNGRYVEILRGGSRGVLQGSVGIIVLRRLANIGPIPGGYAINVRLGAARCSAYQIVSNENDKAAELVKIGHGLRPTAGQ
jgi:hypothetical protein